MIFSFCVYIQAKNKKNHDFWRRLIFAILSSPRPDFDQNFVFSHAPAGKISHKSDITIPFLDLSKTVDRFRSDHWQRGGDDHIFLHDLNQNQSTGHGEELSTTNA